MRIGHAGNQGKTERHADRQTDGKLSISLLRFANVLTQEYFFTEIWDYLAGSVGDLRLFAS